MLISLSQKIQYQKVDKDGGAAPKPWKDGDVAQAWYVKNAEEHPEGVCINFYVGRTDVSIVLTGQDLRLLNILIENK